MLARRLHVLALLLCACGLLAAGCGDSDNDTPDNKGEAIAKCRDNAKKIDDPSARKTAEAACDAASGDQSTDAVKDAAIKQCLDAASSIPDPAARKQARAACRGAP